MQCSRPATLFDGICRTAMQLPKRTLALLASIAVSIAAHAGSFEDFFVAVRNDNASAVTRLLAAGFDPNTRDEKGRSGLGIAMLEGSPKVAKTLLATPGIAVDTLNDAGESPLMLAALKGNLAGMEQLLAAGARVDQPGWSPLHYAATGPAPRAVELLLGRGAAVDARSPNASTPLMMAARYGDEENVRLLLAKGADPKLVNQQNLRAVDFARLGGRESLTRRLETLQR
jgi:uncharacterized protein